MLIDNKKTREISWNNFELEGNKENLIKQGWESFEPYGSGKNYIENWNFETNEIDSQLSLFFMRYEIVDGSLLCIRRRVDSIGFTINLLNLDTSKTYVLRTKYNSFSSGTNFWGDVSVIKQDRFNKGVGLLEVEFKPNISSPKIECSFIGDTVDVGDVQLVLDWIQITPIDNQHLVVDKTPLENGLTRIQTWGGNADIKLKSPNFGQLTETGTDMTISLYVENNSDSMIRFSNNLAIGGVPYPDGAEYMITVPREYKGFAYLKGELVGRDVELDIRSDGNIDMIVSQPEIIEGHDLNAMLLIEDLDDGRKHVQVHNVNENTKLVYTGDDVIKGEPYTLETEIENDGRIFNLSANVFDSVVEVQKGMNDIRKSGELQDKELKIEIGVD